jgi:DNA-binding MurR/RpiR family transcriptional regulator
MSTDVLVTIRESLPSLSVAEHRVGSAIIERPSIVVESTITELAAACMTSQATVARFCRTIGFSGYRELRVEVAAATSRERERLDRFEVNDGEIDPSDTAAEVAAKVAFQEAQAIEQTALGLNLDVLDSVVDTLRNAQRIDIYGVASSALTGQDLQLKLHRIGLNAHVWSDVHLALTSVALGARGSVTLGISHSGATVETYQVLELAKSTGATTIAITNYPDSPLTDVADFVLATRARESTYRSGAMSSRIAQLALVDILFVRTAQGMYEQMSESLRLTFDAVQSHRLPQERRKYPGGK